MGRLSQTEINDVIRYLLRSGEAKLQEELRKMDFCKDDILNVTWEIILSGIVRDPDTLDLTVNGIPVSELLVADRARDTLSRALSRIVLRGSNGTL